MANVGACWARAGTLGATLKGAPTSGAAAAAAATTAAAAARCRDGRTENGVVLSPVTGEHQARADRRRDVLTKERFKRKGAGASEGGGSGAEEGRDGGGRTGGGKGERGETPARVEGSRERGGGGARGAEEGRGGRTHERHSSGRVVKSPRLCRFVWSFFFLFFSFPFSLLFLSTYVLFSARLASPSPSLSFSFSPVEETRATRVVTVGYCAFRNDSHLVNAPRRAAVDREKRRGKGERGGGYRRGEREKERRKVRGRR